MYFAFLFFVSFSLVSAARQADPRKYSGVENIFRAIFEILAVICIVLNVVEEVREMIRYVITHHSVTALALLVGYCTGLSEKSSQINFTQL